MNAIEFVKKFGRQEAIKVVDLHPVSTLINIDGSCVSILDLKQIVDAFELVDKFGGFEKANKTLKKAYDNCSSIISIRKIGFECSYSDLQEAINLLEQCNDR